MRNQLLSPVSGVISVTFRAIGDVFNSMATFCETGFRSQAGAIPVEPDVVEELSFRDVVEWLTANRPSDAHVVRAALLRQHESGTTRVTTVFLNNTDGLITKPDGIPCGRAQRVRQLDRELTEFFGSRSMVIFE